MKKLNYYSSNNLENEKEIFDFFIKNLQKTIFTWEFYVNWEKIKENVEDLEDELNLLNGLIGKDNSEKKFISLLKRYPRIKKALSLLVAIRPNSKKFRKQSIISIEDIGKPLIKWDVEIKRKYFKVKKELDKKTIDELLKFYKNSGLKNVFENKNIKNIKDYYFGIEVGMDTHARKNRTGDMMEKIVYNYLKQDFNNIIEQAKKSDIKKRWGIDLELDGIKTNKRFDFAILSNSGRLFLIEVNYYSGGGSKLKSTAGEYKDYENFCKKEGINFIWITDGKGWLSAKKPLQETFRDNNYTINLKMLSEGILNEVIR